jgi:hypothetical protein
MTVIALSGGDRYVAAAYLVFVALVLLYLAIMATKLRRIEREVVEIATIVEARDAAPATAVGEQPKEPVGR